LGELLAQGKANLQAPWLGLTAFFVLASMLSLLVFVGEAVRDEFDPRKVVLCRKPELPTRYSISATSVLPSPAAAARRRSRQSRECHFRSIAARPWRWSARAAQARL